MKNILFVASECVPFVKTGGLADVVGSLPKVLDKEYYDCRVIVPMYSFINQKWKDLMEYKTHFYMDFNWNSYYVGVMECVYEGVHFYFIDNQDFFTCDKAYAGMPYDIGRFAFFSKAALSILPSIEFRPDIIHCHDWQTGLIPVYLNDSFQANEFYRGIKSIMTIHNLKFQGIWDVKTMKDIVGLPEYYFTPDKMEFNGDGNMLKGGLVYANAITTVSNTYAEEIKMPYYGEGLDGLMRARQNDLRGIVNGIADRESVQRRQLPQGESQEQDSAPGGYRTGSRPEGHGHRYRLPSDGSEGLRPDRLCHGRAVPGCGPVRSPRNRRGAL